MNKQQGFTAIELLITLFVAAAFLIAGYQLFNVVIKDGGQSRAESRAGNVAYDYMRRYSPSATNPCSSQTLLSNSPINIDGLSNAKITVNISCPAYSTPSLSKIEVSLSFGSTPQQTVKYSSYVNGTSTQTPDVTDGLLSWWKFNGDANSSIGSANGTVLNATLTPGQNNLENGAYYFNGTNARIDFPLSNLPATMTDITISMWIKPIVAADRTIFTANPDETSNRLNSHLPYVSNAIYWDFGNISTTGRINGNGVFDNAWLNTWGLYTFTSSPSTGMKVYRNGSVLLSSTTSSTFSRASKVLNVAYYAASGNYWNGSIDDMRIYSRALSQTEIITMYSAGAK